MEPSALRRTNFDRQLSRNARSLGLEQSGTIEFAFRRRYNLPPRHPDFLRLTPEEIIVDYWAHRHAEDPELRNEACDPDFEATLAEMEAAAGVPPEPLPDDFETITDDRWDA